MIPANERPIHIHLGAAVWCFDEDPKNRGEPHPSKMFFAVHILEHVRAGTTYVQADTLMFVAEVGLYVVDPDFEKSKDHKDHRAHMSLLFRVATQPLVIVEGGYNGKDAWRIERRAPAAARARERLADAAGGESDESGHDVMDD